MTTEPTAMAVTATRHRPGAYELHRPMKAGSNRHASRGLNVTVRGALAVRGSQHRTACLRIRAGFRSPTSRARSLAALVVLGVSSCDDPFLGLLGLTDAAVLLDLDCRTPADRLGSAA